jgi:hypothetical protein
VDSNFLYSLGISTMTYQQLNRYLAYAVVITYGISGIILEFDQLWYPAALFFMFGFVVTTVALVQWLHEVW